MLNDACVAGRLSLKPNQGMQRSNTDMIDSSCMRDRNLSNTADGTDFEPEWPGIQSGEAYP